MNVASLLDPIPLWAKALAGVVLAGAVTAGIEYFGQTHYDAGFKKGQADVQGKWDAQKVMQYQATTAKLLAAQARGDALTKTLQEKDTALDQLRQEKQNEVVRYVHDRKCLDSGALRVLNSSATSTGANSSMPKATTSAPEKDAGKPASDSGNDATDRDIANWVVIARDSYGRCAAQLNSLIDYLVE